MKEAAEKLRAVYNTVEQLKIDATYDNVNRALGILQTLEAVIRKLEEGNNGTDADAE